MERKKTKETLATQLTEGQEEAARAFCYTAADLHAMGILPGATIDTVYRFMVKLPHYKCGRRIFIRRDVLEWFTLGLPVQSLWREIARRGLADPVRTLHDLDRIATENNAQAVANLNNARRIMDRGQG